MLLEGKAKKSTVAQLVDNSSNAASVVGGLLLSISRKKFIWWYSFVLVHKIAYIMKKCETRQNTDTIEEEKKV